MLTIEAVRHPRQWWRQAGPEVNKQILNPLMLRLAGRRFWYAARIEHVGRRSGKAYATPIVARRTPDGFAVPLPYGQDVDWLRNVEAAGSAVLVADGRRYAVSAPQVVPFADVETELPWAARELYRRVADGPWLRLRADSAEPETPPAER